MYCSLQSIVYPFKPSPTDYSIYNIDYFLPVKSGLNVSPIANCRMDQQLARAHRATRIYTLIHDSINFVKHIYRPYPANAMSDHVYEELKKVLILAGAFFFITIVCIMSKLQVKLLQHPYN
uniref:Uncharacterized protein n=1 Tax=Heterorhabditis bacteriophora TaxID=37862 RepID=A0A1I7WQ10_HETBA